MTLAGVYGFWKHVSKLERSETRCYVEMLYILKFRELVRSVQIDRLLPGRGFSTFAIVLEC